MADRIAAHVFIDGKPCPHCGTAPEDADKKSCIWRDAPGRPKAPSGVDDFDFIGTRLREIRAAENAALAGREVPEPADF